MSDYKQPFYFHKLSLERRLESKHFREAFAISKVPVCDARVSIGSSMYYVEQVLEAIRMIPELHCMRLRLWRIIDVYQSGDRDVYEKIRVHPFYFNKRLEYVGDFHTCTSPAESRQWDFFIFMIKYLDRDGVLNCLTFAYVVDVGVYFDSGLIPGMVPLEILRPGLNERDEFMAAASNAEPHYACYYDLVQDLITRGLIRA